MSGHTPEPWHVLNDSLNDRRWIYVEVEGHQQDIATVWERAGQTQANARLIAAAPELLEAAQHASSELWDRANEARSHEDRIYFAQVALELDRAIKKAGGRA